MPVPAANPIVLPVAAIGGKPRYFWFPDRLPSRIVRAQVLSSTTTAADSFTFQTGCTTCRTWKKSSFILKKAAKTTTTTEERKLNPLPTDNDHRNRSPKPINETNRRRHRPPHQSDEPTNYFRRKPSLFALLLLQDKTDERKSNKIGPLLAF